MSKKRSLELFIVDIFIAIQKIQHYTHSFDSADTLLHSEIHWDATIRQLEIIGEALNNLLKDTTFQTLSPSYFRKIVNFRNVINHGYFGIVHEEVWDIVTDKLLLLEKDLLHTIEGKYILDEAIDTEIQKQHNDEIISYLQNLKKYF
jgi:uncharacterized protein with HEPN domain